jgi:SdpC family antimicrobial peptide
MNQFTRSFFERGLAVLLASLMLYTGSAVPVTAQPLATTQPANYDGETVFRGVLLDDGPVAKLFPEIWENPTVVGYRDQAMQAGSEEQAAAGRQEVIAALRAQDPSFFDRFGKEMQSGDHIRIQQAMNEAGDRLMKVAAEEAGRSPSLDRRVYAWIAVAVAAAVVVAVVVAVFAAAVIFLPATPDCDPNKGCANSNTLQRDLMIDLVAKRLGPKAATAQ